jgi:methyl-accepting chemotaxis protein
MKNMKVSAKLLFGFILIAVFTVGVGVVGIVGMRSIDMAYADAIEVHGKPLAEIAHALSDLELSRIYLLEAVLHTGMTAELRDIERTMTGHLDNFEANIAKYATSLDRADVREILRSAMNIYETVYKPALFNIMDGAKQGMPQSALTAQLETIKGSVDQMVYGITETMDIKIDMLDETSDESSQLASRLFITLTAVSVAAMVIAIVLGLYLSRLISKPMVLLAKVMTELAATGNFHIDEESARKIAEYKVFKDESGQISESFASVIDI